MNEILNKLLKKFTTFHDFFNLILFNLASVCMALIPSCSRALRYEPFEQKFQELHKNESDE